MAVYKRGRGFQLSITENKSSKWLQQDSNLGPSDCESGTLTTQSCCIIIILLYFWEKFDVG